MSGDDQLAEKAGIARAPEWLIISCGDYVEKPKLKLTSLPGVDPVRATKNAIKYLMDPETPLAIDGSAGNATTFQVACKLKDMGVSRETCAELMLDYWNDRCQGPWRPQDLIRIVNNSYAYGSNPQGISDPGVDFEPVPVDESSLSPIQKLNRRYAYIAGEKGFIIEETLNHEGEFERRFLDINTFHNNQLPNTMMVDKKPVPVSRLWIKSKQRREYQGICFSPKPVDASFYNLWRGPVIKAAELGDEFSELAKDSLDQFLSHIHENICGGDESHFHWFISYFAHMVQKPWELPLVAIVLRGRKGVGKSSILEIIGSLYGSSFGTYAHPDKILGRFNGELDNKIFIVLEEAFWGGDKSKESVLKQLITGKTHTIERKGLESYTIKNYLRIAISGNEEWLVPATEEERRFAVFDVLPGNMQNHAFFESMSKGMAEGGQRLLLQYLMTYDFSDVNVKRAPDTQGLREQKINSLSPISKWVYESLQEGRFLESDFAEDWEAEVSTSGLRDAFKRYAESSHINLRWIGPTEFGRALKRIFPDVEKTRRRDAESREYIYRFPDLETTRELFDKFIGSKTPWGTKE